MAYILRGRDAICTKCGERVSTDHRSKSAHDQAHADAAAKRGSK